MKFIATLNKDQSTISLQNKVNSLFDVTIFAIMSDKSHLFI
ncbi:hypothetical protein C942_00783 [Photobacterium marinum]|uniref:Uncharacterized protein n=1 Tax=Photobacterium marinum TaxID=1056511 RepID=L8JBP9_9GAMM|nr:hypothetical protein C942_00783 [Photobacterium marinum]